MYGGHRLARTDCRYGWRASDRLCCRRRCIGPAGVGQSPSIGWKGVQAFATARDFLRCKPSSPACLVLDVLLPGLSGLDLQRELVQADIRIPVIFLTG